MKSAIWTYVTWNQMYIIVREKRSQREKGSQREIERERDEVNKA